MVLIGCVFCVCVCGAKVAAPAKAAMVAQPLSVTQTRAAAPSRVCKQKNEARTRSTISWKWTVTHARSRLRWCVELWMSSETLLKRSCFARRPNTKSIASITLDLPLPLGPTTAEKFWLCV